MSDGRDLARQWVAKARNDLLNAENNLKADQIPFDTVCFHYQQAAEKLLKAYLVANGLPYPITHDLFLLLERILPLRNDAERLRDALSILMPYSVEIRYPDDWCTPSPEDTQEAKDAAGEVLQRFQTALPELFEQT